MSPKSHLAVRPGRECESFRFANVSDEIDYTECVLNSRFDLDCIAMTDSATCGLCRSGFEVDANGICQQVDRDNCETLHVSVDEEYLPARAKWFHRKGTGLILCVLLTTDLIHANAQNI